MSPAIYYPTYAIRPDLDEGTAKWLREQQGDGPLSKEDVTDVCATFRVSAELRDEAGWLVGSVDERGDYRVVIDTIAVLTPKEP
jgi:hypothetical protein